MKSCADVSGRVGRTTTTRKADCDVRRLLRAVLNIERVVFASRREYSFFPPRLVIVRSYVRRTLGRETGRRHGNGNDPVSTFRVTRGLL